MDFRNPSQRFTLSKPLILKGRKFYIRKTLMGYTPEARAGSMVGVCVCPTLSTG